jgi:hypothetical protein
MMPYESLSNPASNNTRPAFVRATTTDPFGLLHLAGHNRIRYARGDESFQPQQTLKMINYCTIPSALVQDPVRTQGRMPGHVLSRMNTRDQFAATAYRRGAPRSAQILQNEHLLRSGRAGTHPHLSYRGIVSRYALSRPTAIFQ